MTDNYLISNKIDLFGLQPPSISNIKASTSSRILKSENSALTLSTSTSENLLTDVTDNTTIENRIPTFSATNKDLKQSSAAIVGNNLDITGNYKISNVDVLTSSALKGTLFPANPNTIYSQPRLAILNDIPFRCGHQLNSSVANVYSEKFHIPYNLTIDAVRLYIECNAACAIDSQIIINNVANASLSGSQGFGSGRHIVEFLFPAFTALESTLLQLKFSASLTGSDVIDCYTFYLY